MEVRAAVAHKASRSATGDGAMSPAPRVISEQILVGAVVLRSFR